MKKFIQMVLIAATALVSNALAATVIVTPTSIDRILIVATNTAAKDTPDSGTVFSTWQSSTTIGTNTQRTLMQTTNSTFTMALEATLGPLGAGESYQINSATLRAGSSADDYINPSTAHSVLVSYTPGAVTWTNFNNGGVAGTQYEAAAAATSSAFDSNADTINDSANWILTTVVQGWLDNPSTNKGLFFLSTGVNTGPPTFTDKTTVTWTLDAVIVPEPTATLLGGLGVMMLALRRRRA